MRGMSYSATVYLYSIPLQYDDDGSPSSQGSQHVYPSADYRERAYKTRLEAACALAEVTNMVRGDGVAPIHAGVFTMV